MIWDRFRGARLMTNITRIEWCDWTVNPVVGYPHVIDHLKTYLSEHPPE
jgi:hypothetical protein